MKLPNFLEHKEALNLTLAAFLAGSLLLIALSINSLRSLQSEAKGKPSAGGGSCYVTPNLVSVGTRYTVFGSGFKPNWAFDALVNDGVATQINYAASDSFGSFSTGDYAYHVGMFTAKVTDMWAKRQTTLATCSFQVIPKPQ